MNYWLYIQMLDPDEAEEFRELWRDLAEDDEEEEDEQSWETWED